MRRSRPATKGPQALYRWGSCWDASSLQVASVDTFFVIVTDRLHIFVTLVLTAGTLMLSGWKEWVETGTKTPSKRVFGALGCVKSCLLNDCRFCWGNFDLL